MQHDHLKFYQRDEQGTMMGGVQVAPSLNLMSHSENMGNNENEDEDIFSNADYVAVIDYLKRLPVEAKVCDLVFVSFLSLQSILMLIIYRRLFLI